ncbi:MAG: hypothetical protein JW866_03835 [Ignavibacteriales bacterium]|nr:hypothetical protein [Ignavibacteriales bacterium]
MIEIDGKGRTDMELGKEFIRLKNFYRDNKFDEILNHEFGIYFLKMRSVSRKVLLEDLSERAKIVLPTISGRGDKLFEFLFCKNISINILDEFIKNVFEQERKIRIINEDYLYSQLYKLRVFDWGGFYQNAVEQAIVNNYIKKIQNYDELCNKIEDDINPRLKGYILCSWYNHWTSILIEDMFKDHPDILPAVGLIKKVDFFWKNFPFDLKVTYFPDEFMKLKRKEKGLRPEIVELKTYAKNNDIYFDKQASKNEIFSELYTRIAEDTSQKSRNFFNKFVGIRKKIIQETIHNPISLTKWFYENQGVRRFDAANRFFIVLIDINNLEESWKLKRNKNLLKEHIDNYLNNNKSINFNDLKLEFLWDERIYTTYATTLFVIKE